MKKNGKKPSKGARAEAPKPVVKARKVLKKSPDVPKPAGSLAELRSTYEKFIETVLFDSPIDALDKFVSKDVMCYGTTLSEKTLDLESFKKALRLQREQSVGLNIAIKRIPVSKKVSKERTSAVFVEEAQITITQEGASPFTTTARLSTTLSFTAHHWEVIHLHGSRTEYDPEGSDSWHVEEWSGKVVQLEKQVSERTADLVLKNRELEIEAALERVRARAMAMHHSNDLPQVGVVIFEQLQLLGLNLNTITFTTNYRGSDFEVWMVAGGVAFPRQVIIPYFDHPLFKRAQENYKIGETSWSIVFDKPTKDRFFKHVYEHAADLYPQGRIEQALATPGYSASIVQAENLWLGMARYNMEKFTKEENNLFARFGNVFTQAYTRFLDLKKAEEQAREALIEAALEKVRSQSLAMHKSEDIQLVVHSIFGRLKEVDVSPDTINIFLFTPGSKDMTIWLSNALQLSYADPFIIPKNDTRIGREALEIWEHGKDVVSQTYSREEKDEFFDYIYKHTNFSRIPEERRKFIRDNPYYTNSTAVVSNTGLNMISYHRPEFSREEHEILKRFTRVFEQAYIRFRDLLKAEEQAREATIEAALERVRSRSMAMHNSDELREIITVFTEQILHLGIQLGTASFNIPVGKGDQDIWLSTPAFTYPDIIHLTYIDNLVFNAISMVDERGLVAYVLSPEEKETFLRHFFTCADVPEDRQKFALASPGFAITGVKLKNLYIAIQNYRGEPFTKAENEIFLRFGKVFEQAYTRFLDLEKAEAQAEEARIESALEKVRSRSLAMHKSEEMGEVVNEVMIRLRDLEVGVESANILVYHTGSPHFETWTAGTQSYSTKFAIPTSATPHFEEILAAIEQGVNFVTHTYSFEEKNKWFNFLFENTEYRQVPVDRKKFILECPTCHISAALIRNVGIQINRYHEPVFSGRENEILIRFARVFEQAYTRFLDLEKAEAQAREGQIQLALERLRARTMAMHHSSELAEAAALMFDQLKQLGAQLWTCGFAICNKEEDTIKKWMASPVSGELFDPITLRSPLDKGEQGMFDAWKAGTGLYEFVQEGEELAERYRQLRKPPFTNENVRKVMESGIELPTWQKNYVAPFKHGYLQIIATEPFGEPKVFIRFASVFEQTYTRFLDLEKAEAQVRESEIQLALERIRARTMAMQQSSELIETNILLFQQIVALRIPLIGTGIHVCHNDRPFSDAWMGVGDPTKSLMPRVLYDHTKDPVSAKMYEGWKSGNALVVVTAEGNDLKAHVDYLKTIVPAPDPAVPMPASMTYHFAVFSQGFLVFATAEPCAEEHSVFKRLAKVFEQTYTRFHDLQKAEDQAREAEIELALERIRARTMAMHQSDELPDVMALLFQQMKSFGFESFMSTIVLYDNVTRGYEMLMSSDAQSILPRSYKVPYFDDPFYIKFIAAFDEAVSYKEFEFGGNEKIEFDRRFFTETDFRSLPEASRQLMMAAERCTLCCAYMKYGCIEAIGERPLTSEHATTLQRFTKVFEQTYTRFLDLKRAEAQTREAQTEAGLERVRSSAMAMRSSDELSDLIGKVFTECIRLGIPLDRGLIIIFDPDTQDSRWWMASPEAPELPMSFHVKYHTHAPYLAYLKAWKGRVVKWPYILEGEEKKNWDDFVFVETEMSLLPQLVKDGMRGFKKIHLNTSFNTFGGITLSSPEPVSDYDFDILLRFAKVFDLAYTRFNDLRQAEAQAREALIEVSLERVRARAMAMHGSDDIGAATAVMFNELKKLDVQSMRCGILVFHENKTTEVWTSSSDGEGEIIRVAGSLDMTIHPMLLNAFHSWEKRDEVFQYRFEGEDLKNYYQAMSRSGTYKPNFKVEDLPPHYNTMLFFKEGALFTFSLLPPPAEQLQILKRVTSVFALTFRRYQDLIRAEAQAREALIEASLERVRARTMAMHTSDDIGTATAVMFNELKKLGVEAMRCGVLVIHENKTMEVWTSSSDKEGEVSRGAGSLDMTIHPMLLSCFYAKEKGDEVFEYKLEGADLKNYYEGVAQSGTYKPNFRIEDLPPHHATVLFFKEGGVYTFSLLPPQAENLQILKRFTSVFALTFRRYQDLIRAEAQARESQIETALERVRSKAMAMHSSDDLTSTIRTIHDQLQGLGVATLRSGFSLISKETRIASLTAMNRLANGETREIVADLKLTGHPVLEAAYNHYVSQTEFFPVLRGEEIKAYYEFMSPQVSYEDISTAGTQYGYYFYFQEGAIYAWTDIEMTQEELKICRRFTSVLSLTFRRYNDLRQAEANARESKIEASLERVRAKAMAMHNSQDLSSAASLVFIELRNLGVKALRSGVGLLNKDSRALKVYAAIDNNGTDSLALLGEGKMTGHPSLDAQYQAWISNKNYVDELRGKELASYYEVLNTVFAGPAPLKMEGREVEYGYYFPFSEGLMYSWSETPYNAEQTNTLNRFNAIIDLTFRRYMELQNAEANARDASRQSSLDRVRAEIASMRTTRDLERITPLIWRELTTLGVPFVRCGVFIMDEQNQRIQTYLSTPDGKAIAAFNLPYISVGNLQGAVSAWRVHNPFATHWVGKDFEAQADVLVREGAIATREQYLSTIPREGIHLQFLPFLQGMIYVGSMEPLTMDHMHVIQSVADAFSTAYSRYEDFNQLERTKQQVENTLADLKQTQVQLVQSEKMASLGELTAGIAHEIQNPLNFVNNFAEVSKELLDEMKVELASGNLQPATDIAQDVIQNLEKINFHGKRADAIVKSMLQHSRKSSGQKELTDLNALCDEYLRLSYHGLRAKDKTFNAKFESSFDPELVKVSVVSQDLGRVVLNLINNAFYAVSEKRKLKEDNYEPIVTITTRNVGGGVEIRIKDNGTGIPDKVKEKIFQPFFTTKPTGQGTGLGLSLSYDIIKSHGGELKVETAEGLGTEFIVQLPINPV